MLLTREGARRRGDAHLNLRGKYLQYLLVLKHFKGGNQQPPEGGLDIIIIIENAQPPAGKGQGSALVVVGAATVVQRSRDP